MFNLKKIVKNKSIRLSTVLLSLLCVSAIGGVLFSCSFLEDDDFFGQIESEVAVANADKMSVYLRYASIKFGKTTPADATYMQIKNNVAFTVNCVTNSEYAFYRWKAFSVKDFDVSKQHMSLVYTNDDDWLANYGAKELDSSVVRFVNPAAENTLVYVTQTRNDIWLIPVVAIRPTIAGTFPDTSQNPVRNTKLRVQFSKPMDEASFAGNYIISQATRAADFSLNETDITDQFQMVINEKKNLVTFSFREDAAMSMFNPGVVARLYFTDEIADSTGYTMAESKTLSWNIGSAIDTLPPLITEMTGGIDNDCSKFASTPTRLAATADANLDENELYTEELVSHRIRDKLNVYVYAQDITRADGERLESDVLMLGFRARSITDLNGKALDSTAEGNFIADHIETYAAEENYSQISGSFRQITGKKAGCLYTYDLSSLPDGLIQVEVYAYDSTGNDGLTGYDPTVDDEDGIGNGPRSLFVIKDNAAPNIQTEVEKVKSSSVAAPFGWYNKVSVDSIEIYDEPSNPVADYGHTKLGATHKDLKWVFHLGTELDWSVPKDDSSWLSLDKHYKVGAASVAQDGSVSISMRLMDDLGNMSEAVAISSVLYDNTPVVTGEMSFVDSYGSRALNASSSTVVPDSSILKIPFTEELCGVKVIGFTVKNSSGSEVTNPLAEAKISYSESGEASQAEAVALETDKTSLQAVFDSEGYATNPVFTETIDYLNVLGTSCKTGTLYIKNFALGFDDGIYTVTATLYDSALNRAESKSITIAHDTTAPSVNRVIVQNVVPRTVYGESASTYWLPKTAYDASGEPSLASIAVTATENGSGVNVLTLGGNAHLTESSTISVGGTPIGSDKCSIDVASNKITFSDSYSPVMYSASGSISFVITNIRFDASNTEGGNAVSVTLRDFVGNVGSNANSGDNSKFDLYIDSTSSAPIFAIFTDKSAPAIAAGSVSVADGKQDSASDEVLYSSARLESDYTDQKKVELALTLEPESTSHGSGVKTIQLTNGVFTSDTAISVNGTVLASSEYTLSGATVTFKKVFTASDSLKFTNVELQSADGSQQIAAVAKDLTEWASGEVSSNAIILDTVAPIFGSPKWHVKDGVYGVAKSAVVDNLDLCVPFTEVTGGVKCIRVIPKLDDNIETAAPFADSNFALAYAEVSEADITSELVNGAANLVNGTDYTIDPDHSDCIRITNPHAYKSGLFILKNLIVSDSFADSKKYTFVVHFSDAALNGSDTDATIDLTADVTAPAIERIYINRLIARYLPITESDLVATAPDKYFVTKEAFDSIGIAPTKVDVEITISEKGSGVEVITLGENLRLTADSAVCLGDTPLTGGTDYEFDGDTKIVLKNKELPKLTGSNSFVVKITNTTLTEQGENRVSVTLKDFALNSDANSVSSEITTPSPETTVTSIYVDNSAPAFSFVKLADRGGDAAITSTNDSDNNMVALEGFTNEKLVNILVKSKYNDLGTEKRSGFEKIVLGSGAKFTTASEFYCKNLTDTSDVALTHEDATSNGTGYTKITMKDVGDTTATLRCSFACENVVAFLITNVELAEADGEKEVAVYPVDLVGWSDESTAAKDRITLDTTKPGWGNDTNNIAVVMGTIGEGKNVEADVYPKTAGSNGVLGSESSGVAGEPYFYKRGDSSGSSLFLTVNETETNHYGLHFVADAAADTDKASASVAVSAKTAGQGIVETFTDVGFDVSDSTHSYTIVLKDRAGNLSAETRTIHVVKDSEAEIVNDDASGSSLQNNMTYADSRSDYHIFKTSSAQALNYTATDGVEAFSESGYAVYYNCGALGDNPVTITVDITNHKEKNITLNSGVAYYAINGSATEPTETLSEAATAPTTALQNWNKWIPFTSGASSLTLWPKNDGKSPLNMRLWFKDNVGNVQSIDIKNNANQSAPDIWICDNDIPQNANGTTNGFVPENNQLSSASTGFVFEQIMPDHAWINGTTLTFMNTSALTADDAGKTANTIYYTSTPKLTLEINNEPTTSVGSTAPGTIIGNGTTSYNLEWAVKVFLYPSASAEAPGRETVKGWIASNPTRAVTGVPSGSAITLSDIPYPTECNAATPYIYVVAEDRVGNINISKLNVTLTAPIYGSTSNSTFWYGKFIYSGAATDTPNIYVGGTTTDVNDFTVSDSIRDIAKIVPYNAGRRAYTDGTTTWVSSKDDYDLPVSTLRGRNTKHDYSSSTNKRAFLYVDVDTEIPYAYYYSVSATSATSLPVSSIAGKFSTSNFYSNYSKWAILDGNGSGIDGLIPTVLGDTSSMTSNSTTDKTYLHVADKLGRVKTVKLGNTNWRHDNYPPNVNFTGLAANDKKGLYRLDYTGDKLAVTFSKEAKTIVTPVSEGGLGKTVKVYIPTLPAPGTTGSYVSDSSSGLYGYSWLDHLENPLEETSTEICRDDENSDRGFYSTIDTSNANGYYLVFDNDTANATGSLSIDDDHPQTFYVFDKVGNRTSVKIVSAVDDKPPELTMSFGAYSDAGFTEGRIYDASTTNTSNVINCNTTDHLSTQTFKGAHSDTTPKTDDIGYTVNKPYVIYSNVLGTASGTTEIGYVLGTFVAKDQKGTDTTGYSGILTEIVVKRYVLNGTDTGASADWEHISAITLPYALHPTGTQAQLVQDENRAYTLPMPIFLDGEDDANPAPAGDNFKGKLYQITVKDSGGNATTIYLKVMRDRTGPKFKCGDGYVGQDSSHHAEVKGGVGYYDGKVFYQSSGTNQAYVKLPKSGNYSNGTAAIGAAYDEDCGVLEKDSNGKYKDRLKRVISSSPYETLPVPSDEDGYVNYKLEGNGSSGYSFCLYAIDILGNEATYNLYVENHEISDKYYCIDINKPEVSAFEMTASNYGKFASSTDTIHFNYNESAGRFNGYEKISDKFDGFIIKVTTSDTNNTTETSVAKYCFISTSSGITTVPTDWTGYTKKDATSTPNEFTFTIVPKDYYGLDAPDSDPREIYFYAVDYAGNLSLAKKLTIKINDDRPSISGTDTSVDNYAISEDGNVYYFNKNTTVSTKIMPVDSTDPIRWYGVYDNWNNAVNGYSIAATEVDKGESSTYTGGTITFSFADYGKTSDGKLHAENTGAISQFTGSGSLFIETWSKGNVPANAYYLPSGTASTWTYDGTAAAPSIVSIPTTESLAYTSTKASDANKVWYSKEVDGRTDKTFYVNVNFPADGAKISGYKIKIGGGDWSTTTQSFLETPSYSYSATTRKIPINVTSITDASDITTTGKTVSIKAVDGLGNESSAYEFTVKKIEYAPDVSGIRTDADDISVAGTDAAFKLGDSASTPKTIYVNKTATSITIKPTIGSGDEDDVTGTKGFALSSSGTGLQEISESDRSFTITFDTELPTTGGYHDYEIYVKNTINLYSEHAYTLRIIRDVTGPTVKAFKLTTPYGKSAKLLEESTEKNLYYNSGEETVGITDSDVEDKVDSSTQGVGASGEYAIATSSVSGGSVTPPTADSITSWSSSVDLKLGELDNLPNNQVFIAAKDILGNIAFTPLSDVSIKVDSGTATTINKFVFDNTPPEAPASVVFSHDTATVNNGWYVKNETESSLDLYYNIANITATPSQGTPADANFLGFRVGPSGTVGTDLTITLSNGDAKIYAVDKAGNVSASPFVINMIQDNTVAAPTLPDNTEGNPVINDESKDVAFWDSTNSIVYFKNDTSLTEIKLNVNFTAEDSAASGLRGYQIDSSTITTTLIQTINASNPTLVTIPIPSSLTGDTFSAKIHTVDNVGNINSEGAALTITFKKLTNAANVTGIGETIGTTGDGGASKRGTDSADGAAVIYVNGSVATVTVTPSTATDVTGIKGFASAPNGTVSDGESFTISVDSTDTSATGITYDIYAVNNVGLYSANPYTVKIIRDTTGPVVSEITLTKPTGAGLNYVSAEKKLYYNNSNVYISSVTETDAGAGVRASPTYEVTISETWTADADKEAGAYLVIGGHTSDSNAVYIASKDFFGNISYTPLNQVKVTIDGTAPAVEIAAVDGAASFTFAFDNTKPGVPTNIAAPADKVGNGMWKSTDKDATYHMYTMYYNTTLLGSTDDTINLEVTFTSDTSGIIGYELIYVPSTGGSQTTPVRTLFETPIAPDATDTALVRTIPVTADNMLVKINAVDGAGNVNEDNEATDADGVVEGHVIWLTKDEAGATTIEQVRGDYGTSIFTANGPGGRHVYYNSDFNLKLKIVASNSPVVSYALVPGGSESAPISTAGVWKDLPTADADGNVNISMNDSIEEINEIKTVCALWVKDAVGNTQAYANGSRGNVLGCPLPNTSTDTDMMKYTWWLFYDGTLKPTSLTYSVEGEESNPSYKNLLVLSGFDSLYPVSGFIITGLDGTKIDSISISNSAGDPFSTPGKVYYSEASGDKPAGLLDFTRDCVVNGATITIKYNDAEFGTHDYSSGDVFTPISISSITVVNSQQSVDVTVSPATGSSPSLFGGFFDRVSSGVSSVFGLGRSMSHEELMAQKEAKAAKARARAAEKAAKKAAKAAKKSSAKSDSVAESKAWGGLSSGFESSSAELDAAVSQLKSSELSNTSALGSQKKAAAKKVRVVSKNSSAIEVAALASETASEPEISSVNIEETEQGGSKMILVIGGILASLGAAGGIFVKKSRKS